MTDIAAVARVSRTTAYRILGSVDRAATSLLQREIERLLSEVIRGLDSATDAPDMLSVCARALERVEQHPLFRKVRTDEPGIIGEALVLQTAPIIDTITSALAPSFRKLADDGVLAVDDHENVIDRLVRLGITCVLSPPRGGYQSLLGDILRGNAG